MHSITKGELRSGNEQEESNGECAGQLSWEEHMVFREY